MTHLKTVHYFPYIREDEHDVSARNQALRAFVESVPEDGGESPREAEKPICQVKRLPGVP